MAARKIIIVTGQHNSIPSSDMLRNITKKALPHLIEYCKIGANQGIGFETSSAIAAASPNNHVVLGCRNLDRGAKALEDIQARKPAGTLSVLELDVTKDDSIAAAVEKLTADFGVVDILINNAGIAVTQAKDRRGSILEALNTNSVSPLVVTEALLPLLQKSSDPRIINISSALGSITNRANPKSRNYAVPAVPYRMSKAALNMASVSMYAMYKGWGAKVWAFCPGLVVTNLMGEHDRQRRIDMGAVSSETAAGWILEIVEGKRDEEVGLFLQRQGQRWDW